jgi:hypothetical protein
VLFLKYFGSKIEKSPPQKKNEKKCFFFKKQLPIGALFLLPKLMASTQRTRKTFNLAILTTKKTKPHMQG